MFNWIKKMKQPKEPDVGLDIIFLDDFTLLGCEYRHPVNGNLCQLSHGHIPAVHSDLHGNEWIGEW